MKSQAIFRSYLSERFKFVVNLKAAKALGLILSPKLIAIAEDVIE